MIVLKDIVILPGESQEISDSWIIYNVHAKTSVGINSEVVKLLSDFNYESDNFLIWDISYFSNVDGLLADPTRIKRDKNAWKSPRVIQKDELLKVLSKQYIIVENEQEYRQKFTLKKTLFDTKNFGNFHQQLGQQLLMYKRIQPSEWWVNQKFTENRLSVRTDNLYGAIQACYLKDYFKKQIKSTDVVADVGCGTGIYSGLIAETGAKVIGLDPSKEYLNIARNTVKGNVEFRECELGTSGSMNAISDHSVDVVYMSDALLFYFVPFYPEQKADISLLFNDIKRILKPRGRFISVEPHYLFWLLPWLGHEDFPFTILSEYQNLHYRVTTTTSRLIQEFAKGGFVVSWMEELLPSEYFEKIDQRAYKFASEFPLWQLFELKKI